MGHRALPQILELSGGEQQRVFVARALANHSPIILADESTTPLNSQRVLKVCIYLGELSNESKLGALQNITSLHYQ